MIKVDDIVQLNSGSPPMMVFLLYGSDATVMYLDAGNPLIVKYHTFPVACLTKI